jgi:hypothetical protein
MSSASMGDGGGGREFEICGGVWRGETETERKNEFREKDVFVVSRPGHVSGRAGPRKARR